MKKFTSKTQKIGEIGESAAVKFLQKKGFTIIDRNYTKKWGEIDIVALSKGSFGIFSPKSPGNIHFIEVKSVSDPGFERFSRETGDSYTPEDQMHPWKIKRFIKTVETYIAEKDFENDWSIDLITVYLDIDKDQAQVTHLEDIM